MRNGSVIFGYSVENGRAVVDEKQADQIRKIFDGYISGLSNTEAARAAGIELTHSTVKRLMQDKHYLGDDFYPSVIDMETFNAAEKERKRRSQKLGRDNFNRKSPQRHIPTKFRYKDAVNNHKDPYEQAAYVYSLIESEE